MRKPLYANASPTGRDNNYIVNNYKVNNCIAVTSNNINNYTVNNYTVNNYKSEILKRTLVKMNPAYKLAGKEARKDPLGFRLKKVMKLLRKNLGTDNFIEAANHVGGLSAIEQAQFCEQIEGYYASRVQEDDG